MTINDTKCDIKRKIIDNESRLPNKSYQKGVKDLSTEKTDQVASVTEILTNLELYKSNCEL